MRYMSMLMLLLAGHTASGQLMTYEPGVWTPVVTVSQPVTLAPGMYWSVSPRYAPPREVKVEVPAKPKQPPPVASPTKEVKFTNVNGVLYDQDGHRVVSVGGRPAIQPRTFTPPYRASVPAITVASPAINCDPVTNT